MIAMDWNVWVDSSRNALLHFYWSRFVGFPDNVSSSPRLTLQTLWYDFVLMTLTEFFGASNTWKWWLSIWDGFLNQQQLNESFIPSLLLTSSRLWSTCASIHAATIHAICHAHTKGSNEIREFRGYGLLWGALVTCVRNQKMERHGQPWVNWYDLLLFQQERCLYVNTSSRTKSNPGYSYIRQRPQTTLQLMPSDLSGNFRDGLRHISAWSDDTEPDQID